MNNTDQIILDKLRESNDFINKTMALYRIQDVFFYVSNSANYIKSFALQGINILFNSTADASITDIDNFKRDVFRHFTSKNITVALVTMPELAAMRVHGRMGKDAEENQRNYDHVLKNMVNIKSAFSSASSVPTSKPNS